MSRVIKYPTLILPKVEGDRNSAGNGAPGIELCHHVLNTKQLAMLRNVILQKEI